MALEGVRSYARYHRAVLLRDEDRGQALSDARLALTGADGVWAPRARELVEALESCQRERIVRCSGPWWLGDRGPRPFPLGLIAACIVLFIAACRVWGSSRRKAA